MSGTMTVSAGACRRNWQLFIRSAILVSGLATAPIAPLNAQQACPDGRPPVTQFGQRLSDGEQLRDTPLDVDLSVLPRLRYLRLRLTLETNVPNWSLVVRNHSGRALNVFDASSFGALPAATQGPWSRWTDRIDGAFAQVDLLSRGQFMPRIRLDEYIAVEADVKHPYYSYQDENARKIEPLYAGMSLDLTRLGDAVGMFFAGRRGFVWACSAIAVTPSLVMTNWHCGAPPGSADIDYWNASVCDATIIDFSWDDDERSREFGCEEVLPARSKDLDVVFLRVQAIDRADVLRPAALLNRAPVDEPIMLVHHPEALPKQISRNCRALRPSEQLGPDRFAHTCDSETGSSGAPVFDELGRVIGLHNEGFTRDPKTCQPIDSLNKAIRIDRILEWLGRATTPGGRAIREALTISER